MTIEPCDFDRIAVEEAPQARRIALWMSMYHLKARILDVGCGPGLYVNEMRKVGLDAFGVDGDERLVEGPYLRRLDITGPDVFWGDHGGFDVVLSLEVGEHIPRSDADLYVDFLVGTHPDIIYFSAARPGQGGHGHINTQPKAYWVEKLHRAGFWLNPDATETFVTWLVQGEHMGWLRNNFMLFRRA